MQKEKDYNFEGAAVSGVTYGYIRVSTVAQHDDRQRIAMEKCGITEDRLFVDKQSGKNFDRPAYNQMINKLKKGDTVVVKSLDRLGRNYEEMIRQLDIITREKNAFIMALDLPVLSSCNRCGDKLTEKLIENIVIQIFSYVAQLEREMNHSRTMEGIAAAKAKGVKFGRKPKERPANFEDVCKKWEAHKISARQAARLLGIAPSTFRCWAKNK